LLNRGYSRCRRFTFGACCRSYPIAQLSFDRIPSLTFCLCMRSLLLEYCDRLRQTENQQKLAPINCYACFRRSDPATRFRSLDETLRLCSSNRIHRIRTLRRLVDLTSHHRAERLEYHLRKAKMGGMFRHLIATSTVHRPPIVRWKAHCHRKYEMKVYSRYLLL
jgi:hypothetical protein